VQQRTIGDVTVGAIGLGAMPLSVPGHPDPDQSRATIHAALDAGVTLIDTADAYSPTGRLGHNEEVVADALRSYGGDISRVLVATKAGHTRDGGDWDVDGRPEYLREAAQASARRLGVDPGRCLVVEDAPAGLASGRAAGAGATLAVTTTHPADELVADLVVASLADVRFAVRLDSGNGVVRLSRVGG